MGMAGPEADEPRSGAPAVPVTDAAARLRRRVRVLRVLIIGLVTLLAVLLAVSVATRGTDAGTGTRSGTTTVTAPAVSARQDGKGNALDCTRTSTDEAYAESQHEALVVFDEEQTRRPARVVYVLPALARVMIPQTTRAGFVLPPREWTFGGCSAAPPCLALLESCWGRVLPTGSRAGAGWSWSGCAGLVALVLV